MLPQLIFKVPRLRPALLSGFRRHCLTAAIRRSWAGLVTASIAPRIRSHDALRAHRAQDVSATTTIVNARAGHSIALKVWPGLSNFWPIGQRARLQAAASPHEGRLPSSASELGLMPPHVSSRNKVLRTLQTHRPYLTVTAQHTRPTNLPGPFAPFRLICNDVAKCVGRAGHWHMSACGGGRGGRCSRRGDERAIIDALSGEGEAGPFRVADTHGKHHRGREGGHFWQRLTRIRSEICRGGLPPLRRPLSPAFQVHQSRAVSPSPSA